MSTRKGWKTFNFDKTNDLSKNCTREEVIPKQIPRRRFKILNFEELIVPKTVDDLAVHSRKISDVEFWLNNNIVLKSNHKSSMLLLSGPTGCGKTATFKVLCKKLGIEIVEWVNAVDKDNDYAIGQTSQLMEFLSESRYPSILCINKPKVILIEDFPNSVIHNPSDFNNVLEKCTDCKSSVVFICTDASNLKLNLPQVLFPDETRQQFSIHSISFNATSNTLLKKALKRAETLLQSQLDTCNMPDQSTIDNIISSSMGDIRCAMNQFYFTCSKVADNLLLNTSSPKPGSKRKRKPKNAPKAQSKTEVKTERLSFFHSLGRVLNPKREEENGSWRLQCDVGALVEEISIQPTTFNSFIHANYLKYFGDINDVCNAADILSFSQSFLNKIENRTDIMKYGLWIPIIGLMVHNEHKVSKWNQITAPKNHKKTISNKSEMKSLRMVDRCYYNIINKTDTKNHLNSCL
ncbi:hypothetical protein Trydic_g13743 [Trypoxylus dichotomus]